MVMLTYVIRSMFKTTLTIKCHSINCNFDVNVSFKIDMCLFENIGSASARDLFKDTLLRGEKKVQCLEGSKHSTSWLRGMRSTTVLQLLLSRLDMSYFESHH